MMSDSILTDAGSLFFLAWSLVISAVTVKAFGRDLLPSRASLSSSPKTNSPDQARPAPPAA